MKKMFLFLGLMIFLVACTSQNIPVEKQCNVDADCVASACCHPNDTVNKDHAPNCEGILCSQECQPDTFDCQQGEIKCINNQCQAVIFDD